MSNDRGLGSLITPPGTSGHPDQSEASERPIRGLMVTNQKAGLDIETSPLCVGITARFRRYCQDSNCLGGTLGVRMN